MKVGTVYAAGMPEPGSSVLLCFCGEEVHRTLANDFRYPEVIGAEAERAAETHMEERHPTRYRLWKRLGWRWILRGMAP